MNGESSADLSRIAEESYLYLFPLFLMDVTRRVSCSLPPGVKPGIGPANTFNHLRAFPPGDFKEVIRPNFDTLYSALWFDVRQEPLVIGVPDSAGRYYMLPMLDMWTEVFALVGSRTTGTGPGSYALVAPRWDGVLPDGVERVSVTTPMGWIIGRTQTNGTADYDAVKAFQDSLTATPLSRWPEPAASVETSIDETVDVKTPPLAQVLALSSADFMRHGTDLMALHGPHEFDQPVLARMSRLGIQPGVTFDPDGASPAVLAALEEGAASAKARMRAAEARLSPLVDGWAMPTSAMGVYGTNYLRRAVVAKIGLGANLVEDAIYPVAYFDADGAPPNGENDYVLHFAADALPPADAFWSVTMYDGEGYTVPNSIDRYALGDRDPLHFNRDGSLDLYLQQADPGVDRRANWLPSPPGSLGVTLRIYSPRPEALDGTWTPPPLTRV